MIKIKSSKVLLQKALNTVSGISETKISQILNNILVSKKDNNVELVGSNGEITIKSILECELDGEGSFLVNGKKLLDIIKTFSNDDNITLIINNDNKMEITSEITNTAFKIQTLSNIDEFPTQTFDKEPDFEITMQSKLLKSCISKTSYAISRDTMRTFLMGLWVEFNTDNAKFVSTNGQRLSLLTNNSIILSKEHKCMIPFHTLSEINKIIDENDIINISFFDKKIVIFNMNTTIISNTIESEFLDYKAVIPKLDKKIEINKDVLINSIKRVASILDSKERKIKIEIEKNKMTFSSDNPNVGEAIEFIEIKYDAEKIAIGMNYEYLLQSLNEMGTTTITIEISSTFQPIILKEADNDDYMCVIGPMRLDVVDYRVN